MTVRVGRRVWLRCLVKPGAFSNERLAKVHSETSEWVGFVPESQLRQPVREGETEVAALIVDATATNFTASIAGEPLGSRYYYGAQGEPEVTGALEA